MKESGDFSIRPFDPSDLNYICGIEQRSFPNPWSKFELTLSYLRNPRGFKVVEKKQKIVGYVIAEVVTQRNKKRREGHLLNLAVDPEFRRRGVGTMMLEEITEHLQQENAAAIWLETRASNSAAINFYLKMGFQEKGRRRHYYPNEDAVVMVKTLKGKG